MSHRFHALAHRVDEWRTAGYPSADYPAVREVLDFAIEDAAASIEASPVCVSSCSALYGVPTKALNQAIKRNAARFPADFMFRRSDEEHGALRSQFVTSKPEAAGRGGRRNAPFAFTEQGALMAATVLNSPRAVEMSVFVVRAFVQLRELLATHRNLPAKLDELDRKLSAHDQAIAGLIDAIRQLTTTPARQSRPIDFKADLTRR